MVRVMEPLTAPKLTREVLAKTLVGPAGEHWVLYCLYRAGTLAALAPPGVPEVDILVLDSPHDIVAGIQVKTRTKGADGGWHMRAKHEGIRDPRLYYAFVDLQPDPPITYIVPSTKVAEVLSASHQSWLDTPGVHGQAHKDSAFRRILPEYKYRVPGAEKGWLDRYRERWDQLQSRADGPDPKRSAGPLSWIG